MIKLLLFVGGSILGIGFSIPLYKKGIKRIAFMFIVFSVALFFSGVLGFTESELDFSLGLTINIVFVTIISLIAGAYITRSCRESLKIGKLKTIQQEKR